MVRELAPMAIKCVEYQGFEVLYGTSARENDKLSLEMADADDFWLHAAGYAGTHVVVRNPNRLSELPKGVEKYAAELAVLHSKAKNAGGKIEVHLCRARHLSKPPSFPPGKVLLRKHTALKVYSPKG